VPTDVLIFGEREEECSDQRCAESDRIRVHVSSSLPLPEPAVKSDIGHPQYS
jgi:hypothetical protein